MDYDDFFETLDELLMTINGAVQGTADTDCTDTATHYFSYMFDKDDGAFEELDVFTEEMIPGMHLTH